MNFYISFSHNYQNLEATKITLSKWMDKYTVVHPYNEILVTDKKE